MRTSCIFPNGHQASRQEAFSSAFPRVWAEKGLPRELHITSTLVTFRAVGCLWCCHDPRCIRITYKPWNHSSTYENGTFLKIFHLLVCRLFSEILRCRCFCRISILLLVISADQWYVSYMTHRSSHY